MAFARTPAKIKGSQGRSREKSVGVHGWIRGLFWREGGGFSEGYQIGVGDTRHQCRILPEKETSEGAWRSAFKKRGRREGKMTEED